MTNFPQFCSLFQILCFSLLLVFLRLFWSLLRVLFLIPNLIADIWHIERVLLLRLVYPNCVLLGEFIAFSFWLRAWGLVLNLFFRKHPWFVFLLPRALWPITLGTIIKPLALLHLIHEVQLAHPLLNSLVVVQTTRRPRLHRLIFEPKAVVIAMAVVRIEVTELVVTVC